MKILILGIDGYIGYPLALHLLHQGHTVSGLDDFSRRERVKAIGSDSLTPIASFDERFDFLKIRWFNHSLGSMSYSLTKAILHETKPDAIVHLAEQPSAAYSMKDVHAASATQFQNVIGTLHLLWAMREVCPEAHLVKLGTMGEYGTPNCDIPEGTIPIICIDRPYTIVSCPMYGLPFPRSAGSFYHLSKVHDTHNIIFACKTWGLRSTDIMQGVVFGLDDLPRGYDPEKVMTRFDYDEYFGTVINRFCTQAIIEYPITIYGKGEQTRGFLPLKDSIQCLTIVIENPPKEGEYRTLNQFENIYSVNNLAQMVIKGAYDVGLETEMIHLPNPRVEAEEHYYHPHHQKLFDLGYKPTTDIQYEITKLIDQLTPFKDRVIKEVILPKTTWR